MRVFALFQQGRPLRNTEALLLVRDHEAERGKYRRIGDQRMRTDDELNLAACQRGATGKLLLRRHGAGQHGAGNAEPVK